MTCLSRNSLHVFLLPALASFLARVPAHAEARPNFDAGLANKAGLTFSPDGNAAYWTEWNGAWGGDPEGPRVIYTSRRSDGEWSTPAPALPTQHHDDDDPFVSPDGRWLYFVSDRPVDEDDESSDTDIWRYSLSGDGRLEPLTVNSDKAEYSPVVTASGALYFASARDGGHGRGDLYRAPAIGDGFGQPELLGPAVNSATGEWNLWVSADETDLIFEASSRPTNVSVSGDLYYSWQTPAGWTAAVPIATLNTPGSDLMPRLHPDGKSLFYTTAAFGGHARIEHTGWKKLRTELRASYAPALLVANRSSHEVTFVDLARGEVADRIATGAGPHLLSNVSDGRVVATGYGEFPKPHARPVAARPPFVESLNSRMTLINVATRSVVLDTVLDECAKPHASWVVGQRAYITCETERRVAVVDLGSGRIVDRFDTGQAGSHVLGFHAATGTLAVSNTDSGSLTLINVDNGRSKVVNVAPGSEGLLVAGDRIWVGNAMHGSVAAVDPESGDVAALIESVCGFPISLDQDRRGKVWVACFASAELVEIDTESSEATRRIKLQDNPLNLLLHPGRDLAYVSLPRQNAVAEIDLISGEELRRITVGIEPDGLRWSH